MIIAISGKIGSGKDTVGKIIQYLTANKWSTEVTIYSFINGGYEYLSHNENTNLNWKIKKFAGKLKEIVSILTGIPVGDLEKQEVKDGVLGEEWNYFLDSNLKKHFNSPYAISDSPKTADRAALYSYKYTVRKLLQEVGTDAMRNVIHPNIWVNALFADYKENFSGNIVRKDSIEDNTNWKYPNWIITDLRFPNELQAVKDRGGISIRVSRSRLGGEIFEDNNSEHPSETALDNATFDWQLDNDGTIEELIVKVKQILITEKII